MALPTWTVFLVVLITTLFLKAIVSRGRLRTYNLPPGPKPWPIIGNLNLIGELPHRSIHELSKQYGPLMQLRLGSLPVVVGASAEMAKFFLKTKDATFSDRPSFAIGKHASICATELFSAKRLESFEHIRHEEVRGMLRDLRGEAAASPGRAVRLRDYLQMTTLGVISRMVLGRKYIVQEEAVDTEGGSSPAPVMTPAEFREMVDEFFVLNGVTNIGDFVPWLDWLDLQGYIRRMKRTNKMFHRFLDHILDEHNQRRRLEGDGFVARDLVDVLLQLADDPNLEVQLSRDNVKAITQDMVLGGSDTAAVTIEWAISELIKNPRSLDKATEELDRVVGRERLVTERDLPTLPYIDAILKETLRLHPVAPTLVPHLAREDAHVDGYDIPTGTIVFINVWSIGRDPNLWDAPEEFRPERFIGSKIDVKGQDFELLPFGSGRRMCPGLNLALKMTLLSIASLLHGFTWRLPDGIVEEELSMEEVFLLAMPRKNPLEAIIEPRLLSRMYMGA
ncbi:unnamed protein product [Urochloa decumbens]|uniref:trimethyltridecatetraene synthase n=1 Tax=Urochloa decumbens TaxID=240449 RepID=A0ABC9FTZ0_9POAL